jgi:hypothetical protein
VASISIVGRGLLLRQKAPLNDIRSAILRSLYGLTCDKPHHTPFSFAQSKTMWAVCKVWDKMSREHSEWRGEIHLKDKIQ